MVAKLTSEGITGKYQRGGWGGLSGGKGEWSEKKRKRMWGGGCGGGCGCWGGGGVWCVISPRWGGGVGGGWGGWMGWGGRRGEVDRRV